VVIQHIREAFNRYVEFSAKAGSFFVFIRPINGMAMIRYLEERDDESSLPRYLLHKWDIND
jgi:hypothetical protein